MATRQVLAELALDFERRTGTAVRLEAVGGVDAAQRVKDGEAFDGVVLARGALQGLEEAGRLVPGSTVGLVNSGVYVAVPAGAGSPDISTEMTLKAAVLAAPSIGYSTGPSGTYLLKLFERWGIGEAIAARIVQARPGVPVASLMARGDIALGFQQLSELVGVPGIDIVGPLPAAVQLITTFSGAVCRSSTQPEAVRALLAFMAAPETAATKQRHGMEPA